MSSHAAIHIQSDIDLRVRRAVLEGQITNLYWKNYLTQSDHDALDSWNLEKNAINLELAGRDHQERAA